MNVALIIDYIGGDWKSFYCKDGNFFKVSDNTPFYRHDGVRNVFGMVRPFNGWCIDWSQGLPDVSFDVIFVAIETTGREVSTLRQKYPKALMVSYLKEIVPARNGLPEKTLKLMRDCDRISSIFIKKETIAYMENIIQKKVYPMPCPYDMEAIRAKHLSRAKSNTLFCGAPSDVPGRGYDESLAFCKDMAKKYGYDVIEKLNFKDYSWDDWLKILGNCKACVNMDKNQLLGQVPSECSILEVLHLGGVSDGAQLLWSKTAINDPIILEGILQSNYDSIVSEAYQKALEIHSFEAARKNLENIMKGN